MARVCAIDVALTQFDEIRRILVADDAALVAAVTVTLENGLGLSVRRVEEYREDLTIVDENGAPMILLEIKGTNRGVKREHVNQADSHRERAGLPQSFPSILVVNTNVKNARSLEEKDQGIAGEQIQHAKRNNVLILRTLDLLNLVRLLRCGKVDRDTVMRLFTTCAGWLRVTETDWNVVEG
jgi:hypothetical protein